MRIREKKWIRIRIYLTGIFFLIILCIIFLRAYQLQILEGSKLSSLAKEGYTGKLILTSQRGTIFDRDGRELALSIEVCSIYGYPKRIEDKRRTATLIARALNIDKRDVLKKLNSSRSFVWIKRKITPEELKKVRELNLAGIDFTKENRRYYPCMETCAHVIGFASQDNRGLEGIELKYNSYLEGQDIRLNRIHDALGRPLLFHGSRIEKRDPFNLILTLDKGISYKAQKALREAVERSGAKSGVCIVIRPQTGEILAMAVVPEFNPNIFWHFKPYEWRNRVVTDCFEPGSTLKTFLLAAALEEGVITPETVFNCEKGEHSIGNFIIHDSRPFGMLKVSEIIKFSSNIGAIKIGQRLGPGRLHYYLQRFGFGERTGIDLPGERKGTLRSTKDTSLIGENTLCFGQGISVSPLQLAMAFGAIANGGHLMRPFLVKSILDQSGKAIREFYPLVRRDIISSETARKVKGILEGVARDSPAIVILVALDEPEGTPYGGIVAAPVFSDVGYWTLNYLNVVPSFTPATARNELAGRQNLSYSIGKEEEMEYLDPDLPGSIPNLKGLGVRDVLGKARALGFKVVIEGSGRAVDQTPAPGMPFKKGGLLTVTFKPPG
jgi:cell division protein FtsI (penicillin-binding protein 3)